LALERIFYFKEYLDEIKVKLMTLKIRIYVFLKWENLKKQNQIIREDKKEA
jgi:hypothetical protein